MKLTRRFLYKIIKEEMNKVLSESEDIAYLRSLLNDGLYDFAFSYIIDDMDESQREVMLGYLDQQSKQDYSRFYSYVKDIKDEDDRDFASGLIGGYEIDEAITMIELFNDYGDRNSFEDFLEEDVIGTFPSIAHYVENSHFGEAIKEVLENLGSFSHLASFDWERYGDELEANGEFATQENEDGTVIILRNRGS